MIFMHMIRINKQSRKSKPSKFLHAFSHRFWFNLSTLFFDNFMIFDNIDRMNWTDDANIGFPSCSGKSSPSWREGPRPAIFRLSGPPSNHCDGHYILYILHIVLHTAESTLINIQMALTHLPFKQEHQFSICITSQEMRTTDWTWFPIQEFRNPLNEFLELFHPQR